MADINSTRVQHTKLKTSLAYLRGLNQEHIETSRVHATEKEHHSVLKTKKYLSVFQLAHHCFSKAIG